MTERSPKRMLLVCIENSNRSQMAEAFARMHGAGRIKGYSAGRVLRRDRVGGGLAAPVLPHHRTYSVVSGGFFQVCNVPYR
jgi:hypothetical protein